MRSLSLLSLETRSLLTVFAETIISCCPLTWGSWRRFWVDSTVGRQWHDAVYSNDPLNIQQKVIKYLNKQSRDAITSVYDLAQLITDTCVTLFDQQDLGRQFQFFDIFESSIANVVRIWAPAISFIHAPASSGPIALSISHASPRFCKPWYHDAKSVVVSLIGSKSDTVTKLMVKLREGIETAKIAPPVNTDQPGGDEKQPVVDKERAEDSFSIRKEIELLIEIQDILDELDILKMVIQTFSATCLECSIPEPDLKGDC